MAQFQVSAARLDLLSALKIAAGAAPTTAYGRKIPVLTMARISAAGSALTIEATDMEISAEISLDCAPGGAGVALVPIAEMTRALAAMSAATVTLTQDEPNGGEVGRISVTCGGTSLKLESLDSDDFPRLTCKIGDAIRFNIGSDLLLDTLKRVGTAVSSEETRYYLNGQFWRITHDGDLVAVATDGHRLVRVTLDSGISDLTYPLFRQDDDQRGAILPKALTAYLAKILPTKKKGSPVHVEIGAADARVRVAFGRIVITSKTIDGTFPEYDRVIPSGNTAHMTVARDSLLASVAIADSVSKELSRPVTFSLGTEGGLHLSAASPDGGSAATLCAALFFGDAIAEVGFQVRYLRDALDKVYHAAPDVEFRFSDRSGPATIHNPARPGDVVVIMPMRV